MTFENDTPAMRMKSAARVRKAGERGRKRDRSARRQAHRRTDHPLLGDEAFVEPIRVRLLEPIAEGRILDVSVERHDALVDAAERSQAGAPRLTRRDEVALLVGGRRHARVIGRSRLRSTADSATRCVVRLLAGNQLRLELGDRLVRFFPFLQRLAMPAVLVFDRLRSLCP